MMSYGMGYPFGQFGQLSHLWTLPASSEPTAYFLGVSIRNREDLDAVQALVSNN